MCSVGRAFVPAWPTQRYAPTGDEFLEMVAIYFGATSPLATRLGFDRPVQSSRRAQRHLRLDRWGFALLVACEPAGLSGNTWRVHHDALAHVIFADARAAGLEGRAEPHGLFSDLMPPPPPNQRRKKREGIVPDAMFELALLYNQERVPGADGTRRRYLFDLKLIHFSSTWYRPGDVLEPGPAGCADRRARRVHDEYVRHAKELDAQHHAGVADPEARPILTRLRRDFGHVLGLSVGAFAETSQELRRLLEEVAVAGAARHWREAGAPSLLVARAAYASTLRRAPKRGARRVGAPARPEHTARANCASCATLPALTQANRARRAMSPSATSQCACAASATRGRPRSGCARG